MSTPNKKRSVYISPAAEKLQLASRPSVLNHFSIANNWEGFVDGEEEDNY